MENKHEQLVLFSGERTWRDMSVDKLYLWQAFGFVATGSLLREGRNLNLIKSPSNLIIRQTDGA